MLVTSLNFRKVLNKYVEENYKRYNRYKRNKGESNVPKTQWKYSKYN